MSEPVRRRMVTQVDRDFWEGAGPPGESDVG
jgi:hypothetical protein